MKWHMFPAFCVTEKPFPGISEVRCKNASRMTALGVTHRFLQWTEREVKLHIFVEPFVLNFYNRWAWSSNWTPRKMTYVGVTRSPSKDWPGQTSKREVQLHMFSNHERHASYNGLAWSSDWARGKNYNICVAPGFLQWIGLIERLNAS